jgi:hypothetical protein
MYCGYYSRNVTYLVSTASEATAAVLNKAVVQLRRRGAASISSEITNAVMPDADGHIPYTSGRRLSGTCLESGMDGAE